MRTTTGGVAQKHRETDDNRGPGRGAGPDGQEANGPAKRHERGGPLSGAGPQLRLEASSAIAQGVSLEEKQSSLHLMTNGDSEPAYARA